MTAGVETDDAVALGIFDSVGKNSRAVFALCRRADQRGQIVAVKKIVTKRQCDAIVADKVATNDKSLRKTIGRGLLCIAKGHAPLLTVAQELSETGKILGRGDDQNLANTRQHERRERVVDHRLIEDRQQLFRYDLCHWVQARARPSGEQNAFHSCRPLYCWEIQSR